MHYLVMSEMIQSDSIPDHLQLLNIAYSQHEHEFCRLDGLKEILLGQFAQRGESLRAIIFVQQRVSTHIVQHFLVSDPDLAPLGLNSNLIYAAKSKATPLLSVTPSQVQARLASFAAGRSSIAIWHIPSNSERPPLSSNILKKQTTRCLKLYPRRRTVCGTVLWR